MTARIAIAPMLDITDRHKRYLLRLLSKHMLLYSEMVTTGALIHGDAERHLAFHPKEHPVALQLGGSEPDDLAQCAKLGQDRGYDEINLNIGCPSQRVQSGSFGACLMAEPQLVADCVAAMKHAVTIPVTVKTRIGIDELDSFDALCHFVQTVANAGCETFIVHARKAWLKGLSPKQNREIPPLHYDRVYDLKKTFPQLNIIINGGITCMSQVDAHLAHVDGVMIGRLAYQNPYALAEVEQKYFNPTAEVITRQALVEQYLEYMEEALQQGEKLTRMSRHLVNLFNGLAGARLWRRHLTDTQFRQTGGLEQIKTQLIEITEKNS